MQIISKNQDEMVIEDEAKSFQMFYSILFLLFSIISAFYLTSNNYYSVLWFPGLLLLGAVLCFGSSEKIVTTINRKEKKIKLTKSSRFLTEKKEYELADVVSFLVKRTWQLFSQDRGGVGFYLHLNDGRNIRINLTMNKYSFGADIPYMHPLPSNFLSLGDEISHFLCVRYEKSGKFGPLWAKK